jgi:hypothetical protein
VSKASKHTERGCPYLSGVLLAFAVAHPLHSAHVNHCRCYFGKRKLQSKLDKEAATAAGASEAAAAEAAAEAAAAADAAAEPEEAAAEAAGTGVRTRRTKALSPDFEYGDDLGYGSSSHLVRVRLSLCKQAL